MIDAHAYGHDWRGAGRLEYCIECGVFKHVDAALNDTELRFPRTMAEAFRTADYGAAIKRTERPLAGQIQRALIWTCVFVVCALLAVACRFQ